MVAIYGGFFGAGMGILTLAALAIQGVEDMQDLNALKNLTSALNYTVAALTFIIAAAIGLFVTIAAMYSRAYRMLAAEYEKPASILRSVDLLHPVDVGIAHDFHHGVTRPLFDDEHQVIRTAAGPSGARRISGILAVHFPIFQHQAE